MALAGDPAKLLGLTLLGPFVEKYGPSEFTRLSKKRPMLDSFAVIDADIRAAAPMIKLWAHETNLALAISLYLKRRGLIPQQEDLTFIVQNGKSHGLSDEEIITNLLFAGALWLKKQKDDLEAECDKLKTESSTRGQLLDLVPQMLDVARPIG